MAFSIYFFEACRASQVIKIVLVHTHTLGPREGPPMKRETIGIKFPVANRPLVPTQTPGV